MNKFPKDNGICLTCVDDNDCPISLMLQRWKKIVEEYGENIQDTRPDLWDEYSIEEPEVENDIVTWCPMYCNGKRNE